MHRWLLLVLPLAFFATTQSGIEPWADAKLPVKENLELWLDAAKRPPDFKTADGQSLDVWHDGSGRGRHVRQQRQEHQPKLKSIGQDKVIQFDSNQFFRALDQKQTLTTGSIFIVAAPLTNAGDFRGMLASNEPDRRDYESGINIDLGPSASAELDYINIEGKGFGGARNLLKSPTRWGELNIFEVRLPENKPEVELFVNGMASSKRPRNVQPISMAEITVGGRYFTNGPGRQEPRCFFHGYIAEVLVYSRDLSDQESKQVRDYLGKKHERLRLAVASSIRGTRLERVADPPPVQMLLPGFTVQEVPVRLPNVNNVRYRPDGTLLALCYNGDAYLLKDTDSDGLPDKSELFWENKGRLVSPIGMALTPVNYKHGDGFFVASKGKCSFIVDPDRDGKADREVIVAEGWKQLPVNVDATGVAFDDRDGCVYFGLGTTDFTNAYQIDKTGNAHYSRTDVRGTIVRVAPDFKSREIVCTGIRFPIGMAFNRLGDLFSTDQEGATWLPNGNPFDELLHIQKGRHYGFPPRHSKHLPNVIDEPSVMDFGPQHQSTCGMFFNDAAPGRPTFGPESWAGDAIITGESRGKLYRTTLVKTANGYVARNHILACINMLAIDACLTPDGGTVVACHSGKPDWGTGPQGFGKLFKITYTDKEVPQPTGIWSAGPREVRIAFDRPLDPRQLQNIGSQTKLCAGTYVRAGDRFESLFPPYQVVQNQIATPRFEIPVRAVQLTPDRRTLILATDPGAEAIHYAVTLPRMDSSNKTGLRQAPHIDLDFDLGGVEAKWDSTDGKTQSIWLPHLDLDISRALTKGSALHDQFWQSLSTTGELALKTQLNLHNMLRPALQPGTQIDHEWPQEEVTIAFSSKNPITVNAVDVVANNTRLAQVLYQSVMVVRPQSNQLIPIEIKLKSVPSAASLQVNYRTKEDSRARALPLNRMMVPWASLKSDTIDKTIVARPKELDGGSWARGRHLFFDDSIGCAKCHSIHGRGGLIGPDLSNLVFRDYESVLRDVAEPNAAINPDFVTYAHHLADGRVLVGTARTDGDKVCIGDQQGNSVTVAKSDIELARPTNQSTMPDDLHRQLGPERLRDLLTFLLTEPRMPVYHASTPPARRSRSEVQAVLAGGDGLPKSLKSLNIVLVAGPKDHGRGEHDYPDWQKVWTELLNGASNVKVTTANEWPTEEQFRTADVIVFYHRGNWSDSRARDIDEYQSRGGGLVYLHYAVDGRADARGFSTRIGLASDRQSRYRHGPLELDFRMAAGHPIARNFNQLKLVDESYWKMTGEVGAIELLAAGLEEQQLQPLVWTKRVGKSRVFVSIPSHYSWTLDDPLFRVLLLRGIAWAAHEPIDRFNELVWPGARISD